MCNFNLLSAELTWNRAIYPAFISSWDWLLSLSHEKRHLMGLLGRRQPANKVAVLEVAISISPAGIYDVLQEESAST